MLLSIIQKNVCNNIHDILYLCNNLPNVIITEHRTKQTY